MTKSEGNPNDEIEEQHCLSFVIRISSFFRISSFVISILELVFNFNPVYPPSMKCAKEPHD